MAPMPTRTSARIEDRIASEITFPRLLGYRYDVPSERLRQRSRTTRNCPLDRRHPDQNRERANRRERSIHKLGRSQRHRDNEVAFLLAKLTAREVLSARQRAENDRPSVHRFDADVKGWLFPQVLAIAKSWLAEWRHLQRHTFPQLLPARRGLRTTQPTHLQRFRERGGHSCAQTDSGPLRCRWVDAIRRL